MSVHIDCDSCLVRGLSCHDCVVTVLLGPPPEREDQGPGMNQVEGGGLQLAGEQIVVDQGHVAQPFRGHELAGGGQHLVLDVGPHDLPVEANPFAEQSQPAQRATADVQGAGSLPVTDLSEQAPAGRFQLSGPLLQPLQFAVLAGQQVRIRAHG